MKKLCCFLFAFILIFSLSSCTSGNGATDGGQTENHLPCSKDGVAEFVSLAGGFNGDGLLSGLNVTEDNIYNVTPHQVASQTDYRIFKAADSFASFIMIDGEIYPICEYFGGYGFVNAVPCDFDEDGYTDLIVASSFGSGVHRSVISHFNGRTKESTVVFDTSLTDRPDRDLLIMIATPSFSSVEADNLPIYYNIYTVEITARDGNLARLSYLPTDVIGSIEYVDGRVVFISNEK